jgi:hypothetical protein
MSRIETIVQAHHLERAAELHLACFSMSMQFDNNDELFHFYFSFFVSFFFFSRAAPCSWRRDQLAILSLVEEVGKGATLLHQNVRFILLFVSSVLSSSVPLIFESNCSFLMSVACFPSLFLSPSYWCSILSLWINCRRMAS